MRSQLSLRWFTADRKKLTVASVNSGDGGSMLIANLAISFSQLGMRTLVVDANLRQPTQHRIFNLGSRRGLSDVIAGRAGLETISTLDLFGGLAIMPAGTPPPNPTELVSGLAFRKLLDDLTAHADIILCDAPAFMAAADTVSISSCTGGVLLVTRKHKTSLNDVRGISQQLAGTNIRTVGSVLLDF
jgi:capsular exopolysaccharide synthesis family protein